MKKQVITNILFSIVERAALVISSFLSSIFIIRCLPRKEYGIIGVVIGYFICLNALNLSLDSIIIRDHHKYNDKLEKYLGSILFFNLLKSILYILLGVLLAIFLIHHFHNTHFAYAVLSVTSLRITIMLTNPLASYCSAKFNQKLVSKIELARSILVIILLPGLFLFPTLQYVAIQNIIVSLMLLISWYVVTQKVFKLDYRQIYHSFSPHFIKKTLLEYSLWTHLGSRIYLFIQKSDLFFLSFFVSLSTVGNYAVALSSLNFAIHVAMVLGYQNTIALSYTKTNKEAFQINNCFIRIWFYVTIIMLIFFYLFGGWYIFLTTGKQNQEIFFYLMCVITGIFLIELLISPLNAFIRVKGSLKQLFFSVQLPLFIIVAILYYSSSKYYGARGIAISNVVVPFIWFALMLREIKKYNYDFHSVWDIKSDWLAVRCFLTKLRKNKMEVLLEPWKHTGGENEDAMRGNTKKLQ